MCGSGAWRAGGSSLRILSVISPVSVCSVPAFALTHNSSLDTQHSEKPSPPAPLPQGEGRRTCAWEFESRSVCLQLLCVLCARFCPYSRLITWHSALREALTPGPSPTRERGEKDVCVGVGGARRRDSPASPFVFFVFSVVQSVCPSLTTHHLTLSTPRSPHSRPLSLRERGEGCVREWGMAGGWIVSTNPLCDLPGLCVLCARFCPYSRLITWHSALREALPPGPSPSGRGEKDVYVGVSGARRRDSPASPFVFFVFSVVQSVCPYSRLIT